MVAFVQSLKLACVPNTLSCVCVCVYVCIAQSHLELTQNELWTTCSVTSIQTNCQLSASILVRLLCKPVIVIYRIDPYRHDRIYSAVSLIS